MKICDKSMKFWNCSDHFQNLVTEKHTVRLQDFYNPLNSLTEPLFGSDDAY